MLIVFDLDGTLVDSRQDLADSANALLAAYGLPPLAAPRIVGMVGNGAPTLVRRVCAAAGMPDVPADALARFLAIYDSRLLTCTRPYAGTHALLEQLSGRHRLAVLTNKPARPAQEILEGLGLAGFFAEIVAGDDEWPRKPDPAGLRALMRSATGDRAVLVGDSRIDYDTARAADAPFCLARYGFGHDADLRALVDLGIDRPVDLIEVVDRLAGDSAPHLP